MYYRTGSCLALIQAVHQSVWFSLIDLIILPKLSGFNWTAWLKLEGTVQGTRESKIGTWSKSSISILGWRGYYVKCPSYFTPSKSSHMPWTPSDLNPAVWSVCGCPGRVFRNCSWCRMLSGVYFLDHVTLALYQLCWLQIHFRALFKVLVIT